MILNLKPISESESRAVICQMDRVEFKYLTLRVTPKGEGRGRSVSKQWEVPSGGEPGLPQQLSLGAFRKKQFQKQWEAPLGGDLIENKILKGLAERPIRVLGRPLPQL